MNLPLTTIADFFEMLKKDQTEVVTPNSTRIHPNTMVRVTHAELEERNGNGEDEARTVIHTSIVMYRDVPRHCVPRRFTWIYIKRHTKLQTDRAIHAVLRSLISSVV